MSTTPHRPFRSGIVVPSIAVLLVMGLLLVIAPAAMATGEHGPAWDGPSYRLSSHDLPSRSLTVTHGPVQTTLTTAGSDGHQLGDLRVASLPLQAEGEEGDVGRLDASLLTTSIDEPNAGDELRMSTLIFTLGEAADQVVVMGSGLYPAAGSTIAIDSVIVRPITGGSGRFAAASGWAETEHLADDTWRHTLYFAKPGQPLLGVDRRERRERGAEGSQDPLTLTEAGIVRTLLGETEPAAAEGQTLGLWQHVVPAGESLVPHTHPGYQVARILGGSLRYEVVSGEAQVVRRDGSSESVGAGGVVTLEPGDAVIEGPDLVHFGANEGRRPVVILAATLFETGAEPATPLGSLAEPEPTAVP
jgi:quercetin dioxygenase-like cupin family protein